MWKGNPKKISEKGKSICVYVEMGKMRESLKLFVHVIFYCYTLLSPFHISIHISI